jgi:hypothetical protein
VKEGRKMRQTHVSNKTAYSNTTYINVSLSFSQITSIIEPLKLSSMEGGYVLAVTPMVGSLNLQLKPHNFLEEASMEVAF